MPTIKPNACVLDTILYVAGEDSVPGFNDPAKLSSNESPLGPGSKAIKAFKDTAHTLARYPDSACGDLRLALSEHYNLQPEQIICSNGSEQLIDVLTRAYSVPGDEVIFTEHAFIAYRIAAQANGATAVAVPEKQFTADLDRIVSKVNDKTRIVFLANPNNPTGTWLRKQEIYRLRENLAENVLLVIDAAYGEYLSEPSYSVCHELAKVPNGNTVVLHTFSKIYGLASLRIGWAVCHPEVVDVLNRIKGVFNVSGPAQAAAIAALHDTDHVQKAQRHNKEWMEWLTAEFGRLGLKITPSVGNFLLVHFNDAVHAQAADQYLRRQGIIVRPVAAYGLPQCLRISIGLEHENRKLIEVLTAFLQ